ncbi:MAG TPA: hypothetical protein PLR88_05760 [Bacteroidales bacterium]|nr:hypothetical protein [Bacteroidales bacterium]
MQIYDGKEPKSILLLTDLLLFQAVNGKRRTETGDGRTETGKRDKKRGMRDEE